MKKNIVILSVLASFISIGAQDFSTLQNAFDVYDTPVRSASSKFNSMAGANGALGGDASSALTNPAGVGVAISGSFNTTLGFRGMNNTSTLAGSKVESSVSGVDLANVSGLVSFPLGNNSNWKFVNLGINYSGRKIDNSVETGRNYAITSVQPIISGGIQTTDVAAFSGHIYDRVGRQSVVNIALAGNYDNKFYIGGSLNLHSASFDQYDQARFYLQNDGANTIYNAQNTPYGETSSGVSFNFGVIAKATKELRLGLAMESPTLWNIDRVYTYSGVRISTGLVDSDTYSEYRKLRTPFKTTLSAAYVPNKSFAVNLDYTVGLSNYHYYSDTSGSAERELNDFLKENGKNVSQIRLGAEYRLKNWRLRGGYAFTGNSLKSFEFDQYNNVGNIQRLMTNNILQGKRNQIGLGLGYDFSSMSIDLGFQNISQTYNNVIFANEYWANTPYLANSNATFDDSVYPDANGVSEVKQSFNNITLTVGWRF